MSMTCRKRSPNYWPLLILLLIGSFLVFSTWSVRRAASEVSPPLSAVDAAHKRSAADPYKK
jgi:hypothetical protein